MVTRKAGKAQIKIELVESDSATPMVQARPGTRIEIVAVATHEGKAAKLASRLCGYSSGHCLAIVETD